MTIHLPPPPGFQGLHPDKPVIILQRNLPHWRQAGATYLLTFRLADSLPSVKIQQLKLGREHWNHSHPEATSEQLQEQLRKEFQLIETWLDAGSGSCCLRDDANRKDLIEQFLRQHEIDYDLGALVVMPNHVHLMVRPYDESKHALSHITKTWKRQSARYINKRMQTTGTLWQPESFDRIIRDREHLWNTIQYIGANPGKARLKPGEYTTWINTKWDEAGWGFETVG